MASSHPQESFEQITKQADAARSADRIRDAIDLYTQGVRLRPQWTEGWWSLGTLLYDQDRFPEAKTAFQRFAASAPKPGAAYSFLGLCEYETHDYDRALSHFRAWARAGWPGSPQSIDVSVFHFALLLTRDGKFVQALYLLATEAEKIGPDPALAEAMGLASLRIRDLPGNYAPEKREMVWLAGEAALYSAQSPPGFDRSDEYADRLALRYPKEPEVHYLRGTIFTGQRKTPDAEREYRQELQISPEHVPAMLALAGIDLDKNDVAEAETLARKAVDLAPKDSEAHQVFGRVLMAEGQNAVSAGELEIAKGLAPDSALVRSHLAIVYSRLGRMQEAKAESAAFLRLKGKEGVLAPPQEKLNAGTSEKTR
ncbi:MAG TPA: tetratricopeptide repeat protein [Candidatus Sulfotelmatobacter sp.]|nr:tetratricopeptide repeat protein [Candidatus Sulfotelmatobacter sp.]